MSSIRDDTLYVNAAVETPLSLAFGHDHRAVLHDVLAFATALSVFDEVEVDALNELDFDKKLVGFVFV